MKFEKTNEHVTFEKRSVIARKAVVSALGMLVALAFTIWVILRTY